MMQAVLPAIIAASLAASPAFASDEPVVIFPQHFSKGFEEHASYWRQWAQDFSHELTSELGAMYLPRSAGKVVKGAPYSAEVVTESTQTLSNGTKLTRKTTAIVYRDNEGRVRREQSAAPVGPFATTGDTPRVIFISDPVAGVSYTLFPVRRTASKRTLRPALGGSGRNFSPPRSRNDRPSSDERKTESLGKQLIEGVEAEAVLA